MLRCMIACTHRNRALHVQSIHAILVVLEAFDSVSHSYILNKLHHYGIRGKLLLWFKSFVTNRRVSQWLDPHWSMDILFGHHGLFNRPYKQALEREQRISIGLANEDISLPSLECRINDTDLSESYTFLNDDYKLKSENFFQTNANNLLIIFMA